MPEEIPWNSSVFPEKASSRSSAASGGSFARQAQRRANQGYRARPARPSTAYELSRQPTHPLPTNQWTIRLYRPAPAVPDGARSAQQTQARPPARNAGAFPPPPTRLTRPAAPASTPAAQSFRQPPPDAPSFRSAASAQPARPGYHSGAATTPPARSVASGMAAQAPRPLRPAFAPSAAPSVRRTGTTPTHAAPVSPSIWDTPTRPASYTPGRHAAPASSTSLPASVRAQRNMAQPTGRVNQFAPPGQPQHRPAAPALRSSRTNPPGLRAPRIQAFRPEPAPSTSAHTLRSMPVSAPAGRQAPEAAPPLPAYRARPVPASPLAPAPRPVASLPARPSVQAAPARTTAPAARRPRPTRRTSRSKMLMAAVLLLFLGALLVVGAVGMRQQALANIAASSMPYPPYQGTLLLHDPLHNNSAGYRWETGNSGAGQCAFERDSYHVQTTTASDLTYCRAQALAFTNFAAQVDMTLVSGDRGGLVFRASQHTGYIFTIDRMGYYSLLSFTDSGQLKLSGGTSPAITASQTYQLAIVAIGNRIDLYVNQKKISSFQDQTYTGGSIALGAQSIIQPTDVQFSNIKVWQIEQD